MQNISASVRVAAGVVAVLASCAFVPTPVGAQQKVQPLSIHGYLTQAYGFSRGGLVTGLNREGTADYRRAAILARYDVSPHNSFVIQLGHRRLGDSPTMQFEENVKLDMAFFEHRFREGTRVRVGKTVMPFGIYNEIRYAGTLQPFYRAPLSVYWEGTYTSESIDGALLSHRFRAGLPWELTADVFGGSYTFLEFGPVQSSPTAAPTYIGGEMQGKNVLGTQLWLAMPIEGVRLGLSGRRHNDFGGIYPRPAGGVLAKEWTASADASFEKWIVRGEFSERRAQDVKVVSKYAQLGFRPVTRISFNLQSEFMDYHLPPANGNYDPKMLRDNAASINFFVTPGSVLKFEAHRTRGFNIEEVTNMLGTPIKGSYFISSFSVSF